MKQSFLVLYDYGQGGVWAYLLADSVEAIHRRFPQLRVYERPPEWMDAGEVDSLKKTMTIDMDADHPFLVALAKERDVPGHGTALGDSRQLHGLPAMIDDVPPGLSARLSAVEARLGHGLLRLYATEEIPSETDDALLALLAAIEGLPPDDRTAAGGQLSETIAWGLRVFAVRMATRAVRTRDARFVRSGLHALALEVAPADPRDFFVGVAPVFHASERLGMDSAAIFNEAAGFATSQVSDFIRAFPRRRPETRRLEDFGFHAEGIGSSFRFVDDAPRADDPAVRETMKGLLE